MSPKCGRTTSCFGSLHVGLAGSAVRIFLARRLRRFVGLPASSSEPGMSAGTSSTTFLPVTERETGSYTYA